LAGTAPKREEQTRATVTVPPATPVVTETLKSNVQTVRTSLIYKFN
jgi:hypothetical protein